MTAGHPNALAVRNLFAAFRNGDIETIQATIPDDAVWHFPGRDGQIAGDHTGRDAILGFLMQVMELTDGTFHLDLQDVLANDEWAVAFFTGHGTRNERTLENPTVLKMKLKDGRVEEIWEFVWNLYDVDAFWR